MQPLFAHQSGMLVALLISLFIWRVMETSVEIRSHNHLRTNTQRHDKGSRVVLYVLLIGGLLLGTLVAFVVPATTITGARTLLFWLGILLINAGIALRLYAITMLGAYFTTTVAIASKQTVIEAGPYRRIRHPSYTGLLITLLGYGLCLTNWLSLLILTGAALMSFSYRIRVEEHALLEQLGQPYQEYMRRTKRLIPFIL